MAKKSVVAIKPDEEWQVEVDLRCLLEAKKIEADPKRLAKVRALAKKKMMEAASIASEDADKS